MLFPVSVHHEKILTIQVRQKPVFCSETHAKRKNDPNEPTFHSNANALECKRKVKRNTKKRTVTAGEIQIIREIGEKARGIRAAQRAKPACRREAPAGTFVRMLRFVADKRRKDAKKLKKRKIFLLYQYAKSF
jgi:hypothetical protein